MIAALPAQNAASTGRDPQRSFASPPGGPESWIKAPEMSAAAPAKADALTAPLTIGVTPDLRGRIKVAAFRRGVTVVDMLRDLLTREFPEGSGDAS